MISIHCANHDEADAVWRMINAVPDEAFRPIELHLAGHGPLYQIIRTPSGDQTAARLETQQDRKTQA